MVVPIVPGLSNIVYAAGFSVVQASIMKLHDKQFAQESINDKAKKDVLNKIAVHHLSVAYSYMLWWLTNYGTSTKTIGDWKEQYDYDRIKFCLSFYKINLDDIIGPMLDSEYSPIGEPDGDLLSPPSSSIPGLYLSDADAATNGVALNQLYALKAGNIYGDSEGTTRIRTDTI